MEFKPTIVSFLCNWCAYTGADLAGTSRMKYAANIRIVRVMCSGRVDPTFIMKAFRQGADGVLICGCHPGDCHYHQGNFKCLRRYHLLQRYFRQMGIEKDRLRLEWVSASEGTKFVDIANEMSVTISKLGPCRLKKELETYA